ncbi:uncharacterized protein LOC115621576 [Scaptodrosophila lebanonensis]|uniref:Uncharacterized protein LOC115621576 n=1 Tax=Drosophila lebanonensis TaxID=7225 RepID=A0A6J2T2H6_DROLE|nr:uncharacterized protein LOC115621576 [Scaptodrosophila lebanonensis]
MATKAKRTKLTSPVKLDNDAEPVLKEGKRKKPKMVKIASTNETDDFPTNWDVDEYKTEYESEEHWELRRSFMLAHKHRFEESRLVCLAQTFVNMELLGCKYPNETMLLVAELSKDIAEEFRATRAQRLKRTFVSASNAAEQRAKGRRNANREENTAPLSSRRSEDNASGFIRHVFGDGKSINLFEDLRFGTLVLYLTDGRQCLRSSCLACKISYAERMVKDPEDGSNIAEVLINDEVIAQSKGSQKEAKLAAYRQALLLLQTHCYNIKLNAARDTIKVEKTNNGININVTKESADSLGIETKLDASNKGYRMMRLMGWTGGGLGRLKQGREEPVGYLFKTNRSGLGASNQQSTNAQFRTLIENYANSDDIRDMQFEPTFSKEERAKFHEMASHYGLRSASYGAGESRRLLITKKFTYTHILNEVLIKRNPKFCERYFVQVPMHKAHLFPGHVASLDLDNWGS